MVAILAFFGWNLTLNVERLGLSTGIGFLSDPAGFDLSFSLTAFDAASTYGAAFWAAFLNTALVSLIGIAGCTVFGVVIGVARWSRLPVIGDIGTIYVELFRNIPLLLQLFFWYFVVLRSLPSARDTLQLGFLSLNNRGLYLPSADASALANAAFIGALIALAAAWLLRRRVVRVRVESGRRPAWANVPSILLLIAFAGIVGFFALTDWVPPTRTRFGLRGGVEIVPELAALAAALALYFGSYAAENVRTGLATIASGQREAAASLGLGFVQSMRFVLLPQAFRTIIPPLTSVYLTLVKGSALGAAIAYPELVQIANTTLNQTGQALEVAAVLLAAYLSLNIAIALLMGRLERRVRIVTL